MTKLYLYQDQGVEAISDFKGRALLADEMGLGKTLQALEYVCRSNSFPAVVVCPAHLKWVWEHEALYHLGMPSELLEGTRPKKNRLLTKHNLIIINYEILSFWLPHLQAISPKIIIIDECHYQKNRVAKRTKAVHQLCKRIPQVVAISGTPLVNRPAELYTTLHLLWPKEFHSFWSFAFRYCKPSRRPWGWEFKGASHLDELHSKLKELGMIRRMKKDVLLELPDKIREVVRLPIRKRNEYETATNDFLQWLISKSIEKANKAAKAEKLVKMGYLKRLAASLKMKSIFKWVENFLESSDGKIVLFCSHKKIVARLHEHFKDISVVVEGGTSKQQRKLAVREFQTKTKTRIFIGNIRAAGTGITLTAASTLAFIELDWAPGNHTQAEDRIHRIGQKNAAIIYYLVARDTIEEHLCEIIQRKQKVVSSILDGKAKRATLDIFDMLSKKLLQQTTERK